MDILKKAEESEKSPKKDNKNRKIAEEVRAMGKVTKKNNKTAEEVRGMSEVIKNDKDMTNDDINLNEAGAKELVRRILGELEPPNVPMDIYFAEILEEQMDKILSWQEKELLYERYGLYDDTAYSVEEIAIAREIPEEEIREMEALALRKLRFPTRRKKIEMLVNRKPQKKAVRFFDTLDGHHKEKAIEAAMDGYKPVYTYKPMLFSDSGDDKPMSFLVKNKTGYYNLNSIILNSILTTDGQLKTEWDRIRSHRDGLLVGMDVNFMDIMHLAHKNPDDEALKEWLQEKFEEADFINIDPMPCYVLEDDSEEMYKDESYGIEYNEDAERGICRDKKTWETVERLYRIVREQGKYIVCLSALLDEDHLTVDWRSVFSDDTLVDEMYGSAERLYDSIDGTVPARV